MTDNTIPQTDPVIDDNKLFDDEFNVTSAILPQTPPSQSQSQVPSGVDAAQPLPSTPPPQSAHPAASTPAPAIIEIDLHDGSGIQRFTGADYHEVSLKLQQAQENATRKIQEQQSIIRQLEADRLIMAQQRQPVPQQPPPPPQLSAEEEWLLGQQLTQKPLETFDRIFAARFGAHPEQIRDALNRVQEQQYTSYVVQGVDGFLERHINDYLPCEYNKGMIERFLDYNQLEPSEANIELAYQKLNFDGLLKRPEIVDQQQTPSQPTQQPVNAATGLSDRDSVSSVTSPQSALTPEEAYGMSAAELKLRIQREEQAQRRR